MKRSDLTTLLILSTVDYWGVHAWERLAEKYPPKLILAAYEREVRRGNLEYGVWLGRPWLTSKGRAELSSSRLPRGVATVTDPAQWLSSDVWRVAGEERPDVPYLTVPVVDPELGTIAVLRLPDGREVYGVDSPRGDRDPG